VLFRSGVINSPKEKADSCQRYSAPVRVSAFAIANPEIHEFNETILFFAWFCGQEFADDRNIGQEFAEEILLHLGLSL
jgi:hypothetical protein